MGEKNKSIFDLVEQYSSDSEDPRDSIIAIRKILLELSSLDQESFLKLLETTIAEAREIVGSSEYDKSEKSKDKKGSKRYQNNSLRLIEELGAGPRLLHGETLEERISEYYQYIDHVERCWQQARDCFRAGRYAFAVFFSILTIEETGKLSFIWPELMGVKLPRPEPPTSGRKTPFYHHSKKHCIAAFTGAIVNGRLDKLLGLNRVKSFIDDAASGKLEEIRQNCLYSEPSIDTNVIPGNRINRQYSLEHVVLSGEIMRDLLPCLPGDETRLRKQVEKFESSVGLRLDRTQT
jgi:AbiV family abortive infection protein